VGVRDGWVCHLCGGEVVQVAGVADEPWGATVDHLVPVVEGGLHVWGNVALAHRRCNISRGVKPVEVVRVVE
jgi:5-methylcytosine-specific restriction endonuclease McrA